MFVLANFISAIAQILGSVLYAAEVLIFVRVILSWVNADPYNGLVRAIYAIADPILAPFRKILPPWRLNGLDLSPVFAILAIEFVRKFLIPTLLTLSDRLR